LLVLNRRDHNLKLA